MVGSTQTPDITYALAALPGLAQDGICFAARGSGLYRSDDAGRTWRYAYEALELESPLPTTTVVVSPDFASDHSVFAGVVGGILRSFDGGQTWHVAMLPSPPPMISALVISPDYAQDGTLLAGTMEDGVFRSADRGRKWAAWNFGLLDLNVLCIAISPGFARDETLFVGTETGIFRSTNGGRAWREVDFPTECAPVLSLALAPGSDGSLFAGTEAHGLFRSDDQGRTWSRQGQDMVTGAVNAVLLSPEFPGQPHVLAVLGNAVLVSRDGGESWSHWKTHPAFEQGIAAVAAPQGLAAGAALLVGLVEGGVVHV